MAIAREVPDDGSREVVDELIHVGFSPRQAAALWLDTWTYDNLIPVGFTRHQVDALGAATVAGDLIAPSLFTRDQAEVIARHSL